MLYSLLKYYRYIGDGDWSVMWNLTQYPPYLGVEIEKVEDINHWSKKMLTQELKNAMPEPNEKRKEIGDINRLTKGK